MTSGEDFELKSQQSPPLCNEIMPLFDELSPLGQEILGNPTAFLGGFFAGALRLNLGEDPVKSWLEKQGLQTTAENDADQSSPQTIEID